MSKLDNLIGVVEIASETLTEDGAFDGCFMCHGTPGLGLKCLRKISEIDDCEGCIADNPVLFNGTLGSLS